MICMETVIRVCLAVLACYRVTGLFVYDEGPGWRNSGVFARLRRWAGTYRVDPLTGDPFTLAGRLLACPHCVSLWAALALTVPVIWPGAVGDLVLVAGGIAGGASLIYSLISWR